MGCNCGKKKTGGNTKINIVKPSTTNANNGPSGTNNQRVTRRIIRRATR